MKTKYVLKQIEWDTDGEEVKLPKSMTVLAESEDEAINAATDKTGWCIKSAEVSELKSIKTKLSEKDKSYLLSIGTPNEDLPQIECSMTKTKYTKLANGKDGDKRISRIEAIKILGRETWLNGLSRSAFHSTAVRSNGGIDVFFDSSFIYK